MKFFITLYFLCLIGALFLSKVILPIKLFWFLPFLLFAISKLSLPKALFLSLVAGLTIDLMTMSSPIGFFAFNYTLTSALLYRYRKVFSEEKLPSFTLYATILSLTSSIIHAFLYPVIDSKLKLSILSIITEFICMPIMDGIYTLIWVLLPFLLVKYLTEPSRILFYKTKLGKLLYELSRITR